jgi:cell division protein FtsZ
VLFDVERPSRSGESRERSGPRRRDVVMDEGQRSSLEISDDDIDIPPFLRD